MADLDKALLKVPNGVNGSIRVDKNANGLDVKVQPKREDNPYGIPIDRGWAWVIVVACFGMHVLVVGGIKSFGVLFVELQEKYHVQAKELGIIQGMAFTLMMALGLPANMLAQRFNSRKVVFMGGLLTALGFILTAYMPHFSLLYITYGVITGRRETNGYLTFARETNGYLTFARETNGYLTFARETNGYLTFARVTNDYLTFAREINGYLTFAREINGSLTFARETNGHLTFARETNGSLTFARETNGYLTFARETNGYLTFAREINGHLTFAREINGHLTFARETNGHLTFARETNGYLTFARETNGHLTFARETNGHLTFARETNGYLTFARETNGHLTFARETNGYLTFARETNGHLTFARETNGYLTFARETNGYLTFARETNGYLTFARETDGYLTFARETNGYLTFARETNGYLTFARETDGYLTFARETNGYLTFARETNGYLTFARETDGYLTFARETNGYLTFARETNGHLTFARETNGHLTFARETNGYLTFARETDGYLTFARETNGYLTFARETDGYLTFARETDGYLTFSRESFGFGFSYSPCVVMVGHHFRERRSLANGLSVSGSGVGSFVLPNIMSLLLDQFGLSGCLLVLGGIMLNVSMFSLLIRPLTSYSKTGSKFLHDDVSNKLRAKAVMKCENTPEGKELLKLVGVEQDKKENDAVLKNVDNDVSQSFSDMQVIEIEEIGSHNLTPARYASHGDLFMASLQNIPNEDVEEMNRRCACCSARSTAQEAKKKGPRQKLFNWSLLKNPVFLMYAVSCSLANFGYPNIFFMLPAFAEQ
ncbi:monocarboxylate transporter 1, partial [Biomphalaria glabrata]